MYRMIVVVILLLVIIVQAYIRSIHFTSINVIYLNAHITVKSSEAALIYWQTVLNR